MNKKILRLAIPNILSNLSVPILSSVDTALMGHLGAVYYIGAIAIGSMIFNFIYWGFGFLRMGTTGLTAQAYGENNMPESVAILAQTILLAIVIGIILIFFQTFIADISFYLISTTPDVEAHAKTYFYIRIIAAPATLCLYVFQGWFLGMQNAKYPLYLALISNIANIIFNLIFIQWFNLKTDGIALGTVIAQYLGLICAFFLFKKSYGKHMLKISRKKIFDIAALKRLFSINTDIFIRTLALVFTFSFFTAKSAAFGNEILAVNSILIQLWVLLAYGIDGFAFAAESLVGRFIGAKDWIMLRQAIFYIFVWGVGMGSIFSVVYAFWGKIILRFYTDKLSLINLAMEYFTWTIIAPIVNSFCFLWDGIFIGATRTKVMRNSMIVATFIVFLPVFYFTRNLLGNHSLWVAMIGFMFTRGVLLTRYAKKYFSREQILGTV